MIIKELSIEDITVNEATILKMLIESYCSNFNISYEESLSLSNEKFSLISSYLKQKNAILIGAYEIEKLIGFLWLYKHVYFGEQRLHINQLVVSKFFRGKGIGKWLISETERIAKESGIKTIDLFVSETNPAAVKLYSEIDFMTERRYMKKSVL